MASRADQYRRLAQECQRIAEAHPPFSSSRTSLLEMAQVWERLATEETDRIPPVLGSIESERPAMQQQQQVQPRVRKEEC
jgi:hypothetical protein